MTLHRSGDFLEFECDGQIPWKTQPRTYLCGTIFPSETYEFPDAIRRLHEAGWQTKHLGGSWTHYCPECKLREAEKQKQSLEQLAQKFNGG